MSLEVTLLPTPKSLPIANLAQDGAKSLGGFISHLEGPTPSRAAGHGEALSQEGWWELEMSIVTSRICACPDLLDMGPDLWEEEEEVQVRG